MKPFQELTFTDNFMFCKVLTLNPHLCEEMLQLILGKRVCIVTEQDQKSIQVTPDGKGVRMDVYVEDEDNAIYDIEMQTTSEMNLPKRSRYYQGIIDMNIIEAGMDYNELRQSFVIFICTFDYFKRGIPVYTFRSICEEQRDLILEDDTVKCFINPYGECPEISEGLRHFLRFVAGDAPDDMFTARLQKEVEMIKDNPKFGIEYMSINARDADMREEGRREGRREVEVSMVKKKLDKGKNISQIADEMETTEDYVRRLVEQIESQ